jgi:uncharacterized protein involved in response to NO
LNAASNFLRDLVISVLHRLRQSRTLHTLTFGPISGVHFSAAIIPSMGSSGLTPTINARIAVHWSSLSLPGFGSLPNQSARMA